MEKPNTILELKFFQTRDKLHHRLSPLTERRLRGLNLWQEIEELENRASRIVETKDPGRIIELNSVLNAWELKTNGALRRLVQIFSEREEEKSDEEAICKG